MRTSVFRYLLAECSPLVWIRPNTCMFAFNPPILGVLSPWDTDNHFTGGGDLELISLLEFFRVYSTLPRLNAADKALSQGQFINLCHALRQLQIQLLTSHCNDGHQALRSEHHQYFDRNLDLMIALTGAGSFDLTSLKLGPSTRCKVTVSYTHLTLPTKDGV